MRLAGSRIERHDLALGLANRAVHPPGIVDLHIAVVLHGLLGIDHAMVLETAGRRVIRNERAFGMANRIDHAIIVLGQADGPHRGHFGDKGERSGNGIELQETAAKLRVEPPLPRQQGGQGVAEGGEGFGNLPAGACFRVHHGQRVRAAMIAEPKEDAGASFAIDGRCHGGGMADRHSHAMVDESTPILRPVPTLLPSCR